VQVNFGPEPMVPLPFKCRMLQGAGETDVKVIREHPKGPQKGKYEVVFPVSLPDEGTFDYLEEFKKKHPDHVELSDRMILEWAQHSGLSKPKTAAPNKKLSNDKPDMSFGIPVLDDLTVRSVIRSVASIVPRNYVVMEVKGNLVKTERMELAKFFTASHFKRVARIAVGKPADEYLAARHTQLLAEKQSHLDKLYEQEKLQRERNKQIAARQKQLEAAKKKAAEAKQKALAEARKKVEEREAKAKAEKEAKAKAEKEAKEKAEKEAKEKEEREKAAAAEKKEGGDMEVDSEGKDGDAKEEKTDDATMNAKDEKEEEKKDEPKEEQKEEVKNEETETKEEEKAEKEEEQEEEEPEPPKPVAELTDEEKKQYHATHPTPDLTADVLAVNFPLFTIPTAEEGFDQIVYDWDKETESIAFMRKWVRSRKLTSKVENLKPSPWFVSKLAEWQKCVADWQKRQRDANKDAGKIKVLRDMAAKKAKKLRKAEEKKAKAEAETKAKAGGEEKEEKAKAEDEKTKDDTAKKDEGKEETKPGDDKAADEKKAEGDKPAEEKKDEEKKDEEKKEEAKKDEEKKEEEKKDVEMKDEEKKGEDKAEEEKKAEESSDDDMEEEEEKEADIYTVEDVTDVGNGDALFAKFTFEDWALMCLRFELHTLARAFEKDVDDPDRPGMQIDHVLGYYFTYYKKQLNIKFYGVSSIQDIADMIKDTVTIKDAGDCTILDSQLSTSEDTPASMFVKLTEEARRERMRRIDAGDDSAKLKFSVVTAASNSNPKAPGQRPPRPVAKGAGKWNNRW